MAKNNADSDQKQQTTGTASYGFVFLFFGAITALGVYCSQLTIAEWHTTGFGMRIWHVALSAFLLLLGGLPLVVSILGLFAVRHVPMREQIVPNRPLYLDQETPASSIEELIEELRSIVATSPTINRNRRDVLMRRLVERRDPRVLDQSLAWLSDPDHEFRLLAIEGVLFQQDEHSTEVAKKNLIEYLPNIYQSGGSQFQALACYKQDETIRRVVSLVDRYSLNHKEFSNFLVSLFTDALSYGRESAILELAEDVLRRVYGINAWDYIHLRE